jgi:hypothetical protein
LKYQRPRWPSVFMCPMAERRRNWRLMLPNTPRFSPGRPLGAEQGRDLGIEPLPVHRAGEPHRLVLHVEDLIDPGPEQIAFARVYGFFGRIVSSFPPTRPWNHDSRFVRMLPAASHPKNLRQRAPPVTHTRKRHRQAHGLGVARNQAVHRRDGAREYLSSTSKRQWVQHDVKHELLELDEFCPDAAASFPPSVRVKT